MYYISRIRQKEAFGIEKISVVPNILFFCFSCCCAFFWFWNFHGLPLMQPDSHSYIDFSPVRTIGYPFFLWSVKSVFGTYAAIPFLQLLFLTLATASLAVAFYRLTRQLALCFLLIGGIMVNPVYIHIFNILTEALSITLLIMFMNILIVFFQKSSLKLLMLLSFIAGLGILVRPVHYAYVPILFILAFWRYYPVPVKPVYRLMASFVPVLVIVVAGCWGQYQKNGIFRLDTMGSFNMIGKVSLIADKDIPSRHPQFMAEMVQFSQPVNNYLNQTLTLRMRYLLSAPYYDYFRYQYLPGINRRVNADSRIYAETAWDIVKARPLAFAKDVWMNYCALWQLYDLQTMKEKKLLKTFIDSHIPSPYMSYPWYPDVASVSIKTHPLFVGGIRLVLAGIALCGLIMVLAAAFTLFKKQAFSPLILTGATVALVTQSHFIVTALSQAGLPRYSFAQWPGIVLVGAIAIEICRQKLIRKIKHATYA